MGVRILAATFIAFGTVSTGVLIALQLAAHGVDAHYLVLLLAVLLAGFASGRGAAFLALVLAALTCWFFFLPPVWSLAFPSWQDVTTLAIFLLIAVFLVRLYDARMKLIEDLADSNGQLRSKLHKIGRGDLAR